VSKDPGYFTRPIETANTSTRNLLLKQWPEVQRSSQRDKKTGCPTSLTLRVHNQNVSSFSLHGSHPSEVALTQIIIIPLHQRMLSVLGPLLQKLGNNFIHFEQDYSPSSSVDHHSLNLAIKYEGGELQYQTAIADRSINPLPINIYEV